MKKEDLRIVYMGTPDFAVEALRQLVEGGYNVVGVITMPDKPAGRGHKIQYSPVKQYALEQNLPLLQPEKLKDETFVEELRAWKADLQIVVAFRMLPEVVWNMPRLGTFNLHASLLPQYRGAAPINWAVINGDTETGITTFFLKHEIDTGEGFFCFRKRSTCTENPRDQLELSHVVALRLSGEIHCVADEVEPCNAQPLFVDRVVIERIIALHIGHADDGVTGAQGRMPAHGESVAALGDGHLVAIGKFIIECAAHIKVACLIGCCCTHRKTPFDG